jgi:uncharacterized membrane protein HdeD (DUF308 family)
MNPSRTWTPVEGSFLARAAAGFGLALAVVSGQSASLPTLLGICAFVEGLAILSLSARLCSRALFLSGFADLALACLLLLQPPASAFGLDAVVGIWAMGTGLLVILGAGSYAPATAERYLFASGGVAGLAVGGWLGISPHAPPSLLAGLLAALGVVAGGTSLAMAMRRQTDAVASCATPSRSANSASGGTIAGTEAGSKEIP